MTMVKPERAKGHGSFSFACHGCKCQECRLARNIKQQDYNDLKAGNKKPQPELTAGWVKAVELGVAGEFADRIIKERELPDKLCKLLTKLITDDD